MNPDKPSYNQSPRSPELPPGQMPAPEEQPAPLAPEAPQPRPEAPVFQPEKDEPKPERRTQPSTSPSNDDQQEPTLPPVQPGTAPTADDQGQHADDNAPIIADDVDVIEKTWVDKAKQIVEETKDDPHRQEEEVEKLQQSYLKKRYGKVVKPSES